MNDQPWTTETGLSRDEFERLVRFCNQSDNHVDNRNRARAIGLTADGVTVSPGALVRLKDVASVGANVHIGLYTYVNGDVTIGARTLIGPHCSLTSNNHVFQAGTGWFSGNRGEAIVIGEGSWLAAGCMVTAGARVGRANLLCANTVVTKPTPDYAIMAGAPARQVGEIDARTGEYRWFRK